jgi:hypothetical protein
MRRLAIVAGLIALSISTAAEARGRFLFDAAPGITVPIGDGSWRGATGPIFKMSLRFGGEFWLNRVIGIAGEGDLDLEPVMYSGADPGARVRGLVGFRLLIGFPRHIGAFFLRNAIGVDYLASDTGPLALRSGEAALAVEPGLGLQFHFVRRGMVGFAVDFPIGFFQFLAADVQLLGFIGARI